LKIQCQGLFSRTPALQLKIKICCIKSRKEAALAISCGASAIGLVSAMPSGPGVISEAKIARIVATVPPSVATFLLTSERVPAAIIAQQRRCHSNALQLCDHLAPDIHSELRRELPGVRLVQVIHISGRESLEYAVSIANYVDALLLDSGNPYSGVKELGGTGRTHDWQLSRKIRDSVRVPVLLAGGLNAGNVAKAVAAVQPFGLDVCSGVRTNGSLDPVKLSALFAALQGVTLAGRSTESLADPIAPTKPL
jgi:phosphoribosylanthranilate isomerase